MGWNDIPTGEIIVWLNDLGDIIPWLNDFGDAIPWYAGAERFLYVVWVNGSSAAVSWVNGSGDIVTWGNTITYAWQRVPTFQVPRWGVSILKWKNNMNVILGWANNSSTQLNWSSNPGNLPRTETSAFWTAVPT